MLVVLLFMHCEKNRVCVGMVLWCACMFIHCMSSFFLSHVHSSALIQVIVHVRTYIHVATYTVHIHCIIIHVHMKIVVLFFIFVCCSVVCTL